MQFWIERTQGSPSPINPRHVPGMKSAGLSHHNPLRQSAGSPKHPPSRPELGWQVPIDPPSGIRQVKVGAQSAPP